MVRDGDEDQKVRVPGPKWRRMSAVASNDFPVRSIHPQPMSLVHPFSPSGHYRFEGGLEEIGIGDCCRCSHDFRLAHARVQSGTNRERVESESDR
jgi:hypothetical protein